jgi:hypothetical protein
MYRPALRVTLSSYILNAHRKRLCHVLILPPSENLRAVHRVRGRAMILLASITYQSFDNARMRARTALDNILNQHNRPQIKYNFHHLSHQLGYASTISFGRMSRRKALRPAVHLRYHEAPYRARHRNVGRRVGRFPFQARECWGQTPSLAVVMHSFAYHCCPSTGQISANGRVRRGYLGT